EFPVPQYVYSAVAEIFVSRPMSTPAENNKWDTRYYDSATVQLLPQAIYDFGTLGSTNAVEVINTSGTIQLSGGSVLPHLSVTAQINVDPGNPNAQPFDVASTWDDTRAYVTLYNDDGVAVIDPVALQEVDVDPKTPGVQHIQLPAGALPYDIVIDQAGKYAYVSDAAPHSGLGSIYVI